MRSLPGAPAAPIRNWSHFKQDWLGEAQDRPEVH